MGKSESRVEEKLKKGKESTKKFWSDFKQFAFKGNIVDLAVAVIIGGAFGKIVSSLVADIIMPLIGMLIGNINFQELKFTMPTLIEGQQPATLNYGMFIQNVVDFLIIAFFIFLILRLYTKLLVKKKEEVPAAPPAPSAEEKLLTEIRDILKEQAQK